MNLPPELRYAPARLAPAHYGPLHHTPQSAAAFAAFVDTARVRAAIEGRTLVYTVRWTE